MAVRLPHEFKKFSKHCGLLREILEETDAALREIEKSDCFPDLEPYAGLSLEDGITVQNITSLPPTIIVLGQTNVAKVRVVNALLNTDILPFPGEDVNSPWRMVSFRYGHKMGIGLILPDNYELVAPLECDTLSPGCCIPLVDIEVNPNDVANGCAILDVTLNNLLLKDRAQLIVSPSNAESSMAQIWMRCSDGVLPLVIYAIGQEVLSPQDLEQLRDLQHVAPGLPILFVCSGPSDLTESDQHMSSQSQSMRMPRFRTGRRQHHQKSVKTSLRLSPHQLCSHCQRRRSPSKSDAKPRNKSKPSFTTAHRKASHRHKSRLFEQLCEAGYLSLVPNDGQLQLHLGATDVAVECEFVENFEQFHSSVIFFVHRVLQSHLVQAATILKTAHTRCLKMFILTAFDMARDMLITPKRIEYARQKELDLYQSLMAIATQKQEEIRVVIATTITEMREKLLDEARNYEFEGVAVAENGEIETLRELQICTCEIQDLILQRLNQAIAGQITGSVEYLRESYTGTLTRCLSSLEGGENDLEESPTASGALQQILNAAYQVEVTVKNTNSFIQILLERIKQLMHSMPWTTPPKIDSQWKETVASDIISKLSESRLGKSICTQFKERLKNSHDNFSSSLRQLEMRHSGRLEKTEAARLKVRKGFAPQLARLALESTSIKDMILYGMPDMGREIGRGQYGVVYACHKWGNYERCALKSVVPPDEKHWNDLALEFFYSRSLPEHERIVSIRGSVIDHSYGNGSSPAVLLIMDRMQRDLYSAIKAGIDWLCRLTVAMDVIDGLRFLHSQGLVHRDIKLKNVLLDSKNRAKITDLGFCKPEAMMSGSIVGTPIHMAPELFTGKYDSSVDVYAFGILFWYLCAGHVRLPMLFEQCTSKDHLWSVVRKGTRPERPSKCDDECWTLMSRCWEGTPQKRPLLGDVQTKLTEIMNCYRSAAKLKTGKS